MLLTQTLQLQRSASRRCPKSCSGTGISSRMIVRRVQQKSADRRVRRWRSSPRFSRGQVSLTRLERLALTAVRVVIEAMIRGYFLQLPWATLMPPTGRCRHSGSPRRRRDRCRSCQASTALGGADGLLRYFDLPDTMMGAMAEQTVIDIRRSVVLPDTIDPVAVAAAMNPAMSSWFALRRRVQFQPGRDVLVLVATGSAVQIWPGRSPSAHSTSTPGRCRSPTSDKHGLLPPAQGPRSPTWVLSR